MIERVVTIRPANFFGKLQRRSKDDGVLKNPNAELLSCHFNAPGHRSPGSIAVALGDLSTGQVEIKVAALRRRYTNIKGTRSGSPGQRPNMSEDELAVIKAMQQLTPLELKGLNLGSERPPTPETVRPKLDSRCEERPQSPQGNQGRRYTQKDWEEIIQERRAQKK